jgi:hypothetical protein
MAYFKQLKSKYWQVQIRRYGVKSITKTFPTRDEAKIWARLIESEIDRGIYVSRYEAEHITFSELVHRYQKGHFEKVEGFSSFGALKGLY